MSDTTRVVQVAPPPGSQTAVGDCPHLESRHGHPGIVLATLATVPVMALLDMFVVNVALPGDSHTSLGLHMC